MTADSSTAAGIPDGTATAHWTRRLPRFLINRFQPALGWTAFLCMLLLQLAMGMVLRRTAWVDFGLAHLPPEWMSMAGMLGIWLLVPPGRNARRRPVRNALMVLGMALLGLGLWFQQMTNIVGLWLQWTPSAAISPQSLWSDLAGFFSQISVVSATGLVSRLQFWLEGVQGPGAQQDDLIFIGLASLVMYVLAVQSCWMYMKEHSILACMVPSLWLYALVLFYGQGPRVELAPYLALLFLLFAWGHHQKLQARWRRLRLDWPENLMLDRMVGLAGVLLVACGLMLIPPNLRIQSILDWSYALLNPIDEATSDLGERMFPELQTQFQGRRQSAAGGLPNSFLLGNAPDLSTSVVMRIASNLPFAEETGFYMRGMVFEHYSGLGWYNEGADRGAALRANQPFRTVPYPYTRDVWQSVELHTPTSIVYAIPDAVEFSVDARPERGATGETLLYRNVERRSYSVRSAVPRYSEPLLLASTMASYADPDFESLVEHYTQLPDTLTDRTIALAQEIAGDLDSPFAKALAVESFLREFPYDLNVPLPGEQVEDVADHFLFELQRGYCDYYTTAFAVLMRLSQVPTRFVVGYAPGYFDLYTEDWTITDAQAHSWPEIWIPEMGWIPFEPTAGRAEIDRGYVPLDLQPDSLGAAAPVPEETPPDRRPLDLNPQMLFWLLPLGVGLAWALTRQPRGPKGDPWAGLVLWGRRLGVPKADSATELEYAETLAGNMGTRPRLSHEDQRMVERLLRSLVREVVKGKYGSAALASGSLDSAQRIWTRLRHRLRRIWILRM